MASSRQLALASNYGAAPSSAKVPMFLQKLYKIVSDPSTNEVISWSDNGDSFFVHDHERLAKEHLGRWFKHNKFASFVRQLNMYGFHKIPHLQQGVLRSDSDAEHSQFAHPDFHRGQEDRLIFIERKKQPGGNHEANSLDLSLGASTAGPPQATSTTTTPPQQLDWNSIVTGLTTIRRHQTTIANELNELKRSNQLLWQESLEARQRHQHQQDTVNRIIKFLAGVFGQHVNVDGSPREKEDSRSPAPVVPGGRLMIEGRKRPGKVEITEVQDEENMNGVESRDVSPKPYSVETPASTTISRPLSRAGSDVGAALLKDISSLSSPNFLDMQSPTMESVASPDATKLSDPSKSIISTQPRYPVPEVPQGNHNEQTLTPSRSPSFDVKFQNALTQLSMADLQQLFNTFSPPSQTDESSTLPNTSLSPEQSLQSLQASSQLTPYKTPFDFESFTPSTQLADGGSVGEDGLIPFDPPYHMDQHWKLTNDIEKEVDVLDSGIDTLIDALGLDPALLAGGDGASTKPEPSSGLPHDTASLLEANGLPTDTTTIQGPDDLFDTYLMDPALDFNKPNSLALPSGTGDPPPGASNDSPTAINTKGRKRKSDVSQTQSDVAMKLYNPRAKKQKK